ncbi:MAG: hypothetical protein V7785_11810 [Bermanella sp.]
MVKMGIVLFLMLTLASCFFLPTKQSAQINCHQSSREKSVPSLLSQTCLYADIQHFLVAKNLHHFTPNYQLWSDGANKSRWIYLPKGKQIDSSDPDQWVFPVGTQFFKEFRKSIEIAPGIKQEIKVETRHLMKTQVGSGADAWSMVTYAWLDNQQDARLLLKGSRHVLNTNHNIPTQEDCITCHKGSIDSILGFDAIQLSDKQLHNAFGHGPKHMQSDWSLKTLLDNTLLTHSLTQPVLPGNAMQQKVLGYLHANCGNCHNPLGHASEQEAGHLKLRHKLSFNSFEETDVFRTAVNKITKNFTIVPYIVMGAKHEEMALYNSALYVRMNSQEEEYRMPMLAREVVDQEALHLMQQWILSLPTPQEYDFAFNKRKKRQKPKTPSKRHLPPLKFSEENGLQVNVEFKNAEDVPPVMILYWPEDKGLKASTVMDHFDGDFTQKLIVGNRGSTMSLRNSDDVGHTIYVKDKRRDIKWQLSYMPPGSSFEKDIYWDEDIFVEMRCRLHLYMSAWAGSISSRYYKIVEFKEGQTQAQVVMTDFPESFKTLKIWMPKITPIKTEIKVGEQQSFLLNVGNRSKGKLAIKRLAQ